MQRGLRLPPTLTPPDIETAEELVLVKDTVPDTDKLDAVKVPVVDKLVKAPVDGLIEPIGVFWIAPAWMLPATPNPPAVTVTAPVEVEVALVVKVKLADGALKPLLFNVIEAAPPGLNNRPVP